MTSKEGVMLRALSVLKRMSIRATDGDVGSIKDTLFDDRAWITRYLVVDTGRWLPGRKVLISPIAVRALNWQENVAEVSITRDQVKGSPDIDTDKPVSRQHEASYSDYYGYPYYWGTSFALGTFGSPLPMVSSPSADSAVAEARAAERERADPNLRSADALSGYRIEAQDGEIGHVDDFLYDEETWRLRYLVIDTRTWLPGRRVLVSIEWTSNVSWEDRSVRVDLTKDAIRQSPELDLEHSLTPEAELSLHRHYGKSIDQSTSRSRPMR
jgi:hypothetical protein